MGDVVYLGRSQRPPVTTIGEPMLRGHNARLEFDRTDTHHFGDELIETLKAYHPAVSLSQLGRVQADVTFVAHDIPHAADMAIAIAAEVGGVSLVALEVTSTEDFDRL
ncbi:hypothetical protein N866_07290 [Actinotalea ferrariae CF5-4]|uniref:Uncharacterized protein n=1 Tax=Actinotalea ferrariae CF5-4 TaxID=948458 RepID=A0A021VU39_9CELL|nr:hypothetical protein [Actinotalea ferrariae]EYR62587.1 hypothetical protein N866_07290 [Actinotalea ferrariae CF5-4]